MNASKEMKISSRIFSWITKEIVSNFVCKVVDIHDFIDNRIYNTQYVITHVTTHMHTYSHSAHIFTQRTHIHTAHTLAKSFESKSFGGVVIYIIVSLLMIVIVIIVVSLIVVIVVSLIVGSTS
jgi:hypothetical protein